MVCIYCGGKTSVTNSRPQKRLGQVWRRRQCQSCGAAFTTNEAVDHATSLVVRSGASVAPLTRDKLFVSLYRALGHRKSAVEDATALTATILSKLRLVAANATLTPENIAETALGILKRFDEAAAVQYAAYHRY